MEAEMESHVDPKEETVVALNMDGSVKGPTTLGRSNRRRNSITKKNLDAISTGGNTISRSTRRRNSVTKKDLDASMGSHLNASRANRRLPIKKPNQPDPEMIAKILKEPLVVPTGASPLPNKDYIELEGFVMARLSFRTLLMKAWKKVYWIQYGPSAVLFFRSKDDANEWLENPRLTWKQRNAKIRFKIDFVHALEGPNVKGFKANKMKMKQYGVKNMHQFKLERWTDAGLVVHAAFASDMLDEVMELRETLLECMDHSTADKFEDDVLNDPTPYKRF